MTEFEDRLSLRNLEEKRLVLNAKSNRLEQIQGLCEELYADFDFNKKFTERLTKFIESINEQFIAIEMEVEIIESDIRNKHYI